jgi:hypothetical protein
MSRRSTCGELSNPQASIWVYTAAARWPGIYLVVCGYFPGMAGKVRVHEIE